MIQSIGKVFLIVVIFASTGCWRDGALIVNEPIGVVEKSLNNIPVLMHENDVVGLSVIVIRDNKVRISKFFGYADLGLARKINEHTVYKAASLGKPIFAYIVVSLAQQKKIDLDKPLYLYRGGDVVDNDPFSKEITARMVLSHTTGLPNLGKQVTPKFSFKPGSDFQYSGYGYQYLQGVIETITQKSLNALAIEIVFTPLSMIASSYQWRKDYEDVISNSYGDSADKYEVNQEAQTGYAAWSLYTTPEDYSKFVTHIMSSSKEIGSIASQLLTPTVNVAKGVKWGVGWGIQDTTPNESFWHWGSKAGFKHFVVAYPVEKVAVIVMTNSRKSFQIVDDIMAISIGGSYPSYDWF
ncbi:MAG: beta-lactamase family protein [Pseudomonadales bacterium]|nr:beta-lactamase family protein [Pseudomonadales bacterium]